MIVRIDDYPWANPAGVIEHHIGVYRRLLQVFEDHEVPYVLGVTPALIVGADIKFLQSLRFAEIAMHGWDHAFDRPGHRDEFAELNAGQIHRLLVRGLARLEPFHPRMYIPTFNTITQPLLDALRVTPMRDMTTGFDWPDFAPHREWEGLRLWTPRAEFYGRGHEILPHMDTFGPDDHIVLHLTWERPLMRAPGEVHHLDELVRRVKERAARPA